MGCCSQWPTMSREPPVKKIWEPLPEALDLPRRKPALCIASLPVLFFCHASLCYLFEMGLGLDFSRIYVVRCPKSYETEGLDMEQFS